MAVSPYCKKHQVGLEGEPILTQTIPLWWEVDLSEMRCPKESDDCQLTWDVTVS